MQERLFLYPKSSWPPYNHNLMQQIRGMPQSLRQRWTEEDLFLLTKHKRVNFIDWKDRPINLRWKNAVDQAKTWLRCPTWVLMCRCSVGDWRWHSSRRETPSQAGKSLLQARATLATWLGTSWLQTRENFASMATMAGWLGTSWLGLALQGNLIIISHEWSALHWGWLKTDRKEGRVKWGEWGVED